MMSQIFEGEFYEPPQFTKTTQSGKAMHVHLQNNWYLTKKPLSEKMTQVPTFTSETTDIAGDDAGSGFTQKFSFT